MTEAKVIPISSAFIWRRVHSLAGFWLVIYLFQHLVINSQLALWIGDDGIGFIRCVNLLESLPYLQIIESLLIGFPLFVHAIWGIKRIFSAKPNSFSTKDKSPHLPYSRNRAFTWQRLSSWILLVGIIGHVIQMRFIDYPKEVLKNNETRYLAVVSFDEGLYTLAPRLKANLYSAKEIARLHASSPDGEWDHALKAFHLKAHERVADSPSPGVSMLLSVRNTFKSPLMGFFYTLFVLAAAFHAFNGFWTFLITWGLILSYRSQKAMIPVSVIGIALLSFLGLAAIWGSFWINLRN